ncbi:S1 RNA-binding domain-containing protein [Kitasatospora sp. NPDC057198]|uniref:S1 RNA-binding domain-containing protein n=1 Tax=Kitasatospora sp. NPDC057198 TaxID=3346046 RepID=UPI00363CFDE6
MDETAGGAADGGAVRGFLATVRVGELRSGVVTGISRSRGAEVVLDGFAAEALGRVGLLDLPWGQRREEAVRVGRRISAEVIAVDLEQGCVWLSMAAAEHPELWAFLGRLERGEVLSGTVAAIERFGVFVALDEGPGHPVFPGVGFVTLPELSWSRFEAVTDVVRVGDRVRGEFLQFDTWNGEARLSLRALQPDPFRVFADGHEAGRTLRGTVTRLVPFGVFVRVADGVEGLVPSEALGPAEGTLRVGDEVPVVVAGVDRERRRLTLALR